MKAPILFFLGSGGSKENILIMITHISMKHEDRSITSKLKNTVQKAREFFQNFIYIKI
jgi:hypothetical protein